MNRPLLIVRPQPGNEQTVARAAAMGMRTIACPLARIAPLDWIAPEPAGFEALLFTSANAVATAAPKLGMLAQLPIWAVGAATADAARAAGLTLARVGEQGITELLAGAPPRPLLHLCGEHRTPPAAGWPISAIPVYSSVLLDPPAAFFDALSTKPIILLHSARMARYVAAHCPSRGDITLVTISAEVAQAAGTGWQRVAVANQTSDEAMLDLARSLID